jgi:hypothetical protein
MGVGVNFQAAISTIGSSQLFDRPWFSGIHLKTKSQPHSGWLKIATPSRGGSAAIH